MRAVRAECTLASSLSPRLVVVLSSLLSLPMSSASNEREVTLTQSRDTIYRLVGYEASSLEEDGWMNWRGRSHNQFPFPFRFQWEDEREGGSGCQCHLPSFLPPLHCFGISGSLAALNVKAFGRHFFPDRLRCFGGL